MLIIYINYFLKIIYIIQIIQALAPFVSKILENFVKIMIGEEYKLGSDLIFKLDEDFNSQIHSNKIRDY